MSLSRSIFRFMILAAVACSSGAAIPLHVGGAAPRGDGPTLNPRSANAEQFFQSTRVYSFDLTISAADFARMPPSTGRGGRGMGGWEAATPTDGSGYTKVPATLRFEGRDWGPVVLRYKGNSSYRGARTPLKRSLKIDFNVPGQHRLFFGLSKLNLNNNAFDSSQMRETLAYDVFRHEGVPAPRTAYARVFISVPGQHEHEYAGLFTVVEQIDQAFFLDRWGSRIGVLLKPEGLSGLPDLGNDWKSYATSYSAKIPTKSHDAQRLIAFVQFVDHASDEDFVRHIGEYLDVDEFIRFLASEVVIVNSDSPLAMNHNYYLTINPQTKKVVWVPWDMNMAFGGFRRGEVNLSVDHPSAPGTFPLADRILADPALLERYRQSVRDMLSSSASRTRLDEELHRLAGSIRAAVALDPTTNVTQFDANLIEKDAAQAQGQPNNAPFAEFGDPGFHDRNGPALRQFIDERIESVRAQVDHKLSGVPGRAGFGSGAQ